MSPRDCCERCNLLLALTAGISSGGNAVCPLLSAVFKLLVSSVNILVCSSSVFFVCLFEGKLDEVYGALAKAHPNMTVYKKEQIPDRLHYKHNSKIQPILALADKGWEIVYNKSDGFQCKYSIFTVFTYICIYMCIYMCVYIYLYICLHISLYLPSQRPYMVLSLPV